MRRPLHLMLAVLAALALLAAACGGGGDDDSGGGGDGDEGAAADLPECPLDALEGAEEPVEITLWHYASAQNLAALEDMVAQFNESQDQIVVTAEKVGDSAEEAGRAYNSAIASDGLPDLTIFEDTQLQYASDTDTVLPATSCYEAGAESPAWLPIVDPAFSIDGVQWASSVNLSSPVLYYNRGDFEAAGLDPDDPPGTLDEIRAAAEAIKNEGVVDQPFVFLVNPWYLETWMTGIGQTIVNEDNGRAGVATEATLENDNVVEVLQWLQDMNDDGLMNPIRQTPGVIDQFLAVGTGQGSMLLETSTASVSIEAFVEGDLDAGELTDDGRVPTDLDLTLDVGAAEVPGVEAPGQAQAAGAFWTIASTSPPEEQAAAWEFLTWWNELAQQVQWNLEGGVLPAIQGAAEDPELQETWENTLSGQWLALAYAQVAAVNPDFPGPAMGPYTQVRDIVREQMEAVIFSGTDPADAAAAMQEEATEALATYEEESF